MTKSKVDRQTKQARVRIHRGVQLTGLLLLVAVLAAFLGESWLAELGGLGAVVVGVLTAVGYWKLKQGRHQH
ncbi:hypothetical protein PVT67_17170 [Gallaecimonas kandeliae]|uniref:hypothetical protein n=1 Tax=Gallaecimonas kandeliae TaxID=3029055 RepID=UPI00264A3526|nr:hypothetical protein [Gallaecimonas kandeliae]WKE65374.1 hypothetical protein PVT67_17170 [Gallaecimonas kandeliae]